MIREYKVNRQIESRMVSLVLPDGSMKREVALSEALTMAEDQSLDLVEMSESKNDKLPLCKIMDYGKMMYHNSKKKKSNKKISHTKDIKYGFNISDHDLNVKHNKVEEFLSKNYIVRYVLELRGREKNMIEEAVKKILKNLSDFEEIAIWKEPKVSVGSRRAEISTTLNAK